MKSISFLLATALFLPLTCMAEDMVFPWNLEKRNAQTYRPIVPDAIAVTAHVEYGDGGGKSVYFDLDYYDTKDGKILSKGTCDPAKYTVQDFSTGIMTINGQAIKVIEWCKKYNDLGTNFYQATPQTDQGLAFVVKSLSDASSTVNIELKGIPFKLSADGFSAVWNNTSDKAL